MLNWKTILKVRKNKIAYPNVRYVAVGVFVTESEQINWH